MFSAVETGQKPKCYATHGLLPLDLKLDKVPKAKRPFSTILASPWYHTVHLILPSELLSIVSNALDRESYYLSYSRVHMSLSDIITGDFFNTHIKTGTIEMLSQGSPITENQYSLNDGILRLDIPKHIFQRLGLDGRPIPSGGRKHVPIRMRVELNLRLPSMISGRKGFERIKWAFANVLNETVTWLFRDCSKDVAAADTEEAKIRPIASLHPVQRSAHPPQQRTLENTLIPSLRAPRRDGDSSSEFLRSDASSDILEWFSLAIANSPRIDSTDTIDPYLCRYALPTDTTTTSSVTLLRWHGFIPADWVSRITALCSSLLQRDADAWFAINANSIRLDEGHEISNGWCYLYPQLEDEGPIASSLPSQSETADEEVDAVRVQSASREGQSSSAEVLTKKPQRDFVLWQFVDCTTLR